MTSLVLMCIYLNLKSLLIVSDVLHMIEIHVHIKQFQERDQLYICLVIILCSVYEWKLFSIYSEVYILELLN